MCGAFFGYWSCCLVLGVLVVCRVCVLYLVIDECCSVQCCSVCMEGFEFMFGFLNVLCSGGVVCMCCGSWGCCPVYGRVEGCDAF